MHLVAEDPVVAGNQKGMSPADTNPADTRPMDMNQGDMHRVHRWNKAAVEAENRGRLEHRSLGERSLVDHHSLRPMGEVWEVSQEAPEEVDSMDTAGHSR